MRLHTLALAVAACGLVGLLLEDAFAQRITPRAPRAPGSFQAPRAPGAPMATGINRRPLSKPHSDIYRRPTVSPYLNLLSEDADPGLPAYQTLVRPMVEQEATQRSQQLNLQRLNTQMQQLRQDIATPPGGSTELRATGHTVRFMNFSHYYPSR